MVCSRSEVRVIQMIKEIIECSSTSLVVSATTGRDKECCASIFSPSFFTSQLGLLKGSLYRIEIPLSLPLTMTYSGRGQITWRKATELAKKRLTTCQAGLNNTLDFLRFPLLHKQCNSRIFHARLLCLEKVLQNVVNYWGRLEI